MAASQTGSVLGRRKQARPEPEEPFYGFDGFELPLGEAAPAVATADTELEIDWQGQLEWPMVPKHMPDHAGTIVAKVMEVDGVDLDYSVQSLVAVDAVLGRFHDGGDDPDRIFETMVRFGAYIGEVMNRTTGSRWVVLPGSHPLNRGGWWPMIQHARRFANPIGKVRKRVALGAGESIPYFYDVMTSGGAEPPR